MTRSDLMNTIAEKNPHLAVRGLANKAVKIFFEEMERTLVGGGRIELRGLGTFTVKTRKERKGRNPKNGESVYIAEKRTPAFKMGKLFKEVLNPAA